MALKQLLCSLVLLVLLFLCQMFYEATTQQCSAAEDSIFGMMLRGHIFKEITGASLALECLQACNRDVRCQSFNFVISQHLCELSDRTKEARPEDFVPNSDRFYFRRERNRGKLLL